VVRFRTYRALTAALLLVFPWRFVPAIGQQSDSTPAAQIPSRSELLLQGEVRGFQNHTFIEVPFRVPAQLQRVTISFAYTGKEEQTALDLGLLDPATLRRLATAASSPSSAVLLSAPATFRPGTRIS
jgi:hypothetical protein